MSLLLNISPLELAKLWGELLEAYHGISGFGGHTAEIYSYRFQRYCPSAHSMLVEESQRDLHISAAKDLVGLVNLFASYYPSAEMLIDDRKPDIWLTETLTYGGFSHRARVHVVHAADLEDDCQ